MERTRRVWIVVWTHYNNESGIGANDCTERLDRFASEAEAMDFARFRTCYREAATADCHEVPVRIARRWGL